jgi:hypothetical protein
MTFLSTIKETLMPRKKQTDEPIAVVEEAPTPKPKAKPAAKTQKAVSRLEHKYRRKAHG